MALVVHRWSGTATDRNDPGSAAHRGGSHGLPQSQTPGPRCAAPGTRRL